MRAMFWLVVLAAIVALIYTVKLMRQRYEQRRRASEERAARLLAQVVPQALPSKEAVVPQRRADPQERLLLDAAAKAGEAGEPALAIQLYARLLARYPESSYASQARSAAEEQKRKLARA